MNAYPHTQVDHVGDDDDDNNDAGHGPHVLDKIDLTFLRHSSAHEEKEVYYVEKPLIDLYYKTDLCLSFVHCAFLAVTCPSCWFCDEPCRAFDQRVIDLSSPSQQKTFENALIQEQNVHIQHQHWVVWALPVAFLVRRVVPQQAVVEGGKDEVASLEEDPAHRHDEECDDFRGYEIFQDSCA